MAILKDEIPAFLTDETLSEKERNLLLRIACLELKRRYIMIPKSFFFTGAALIAISSLGATAEVGLTQVPFYGWIVLGFCIVVIALGLGLLPRWGSGIKNDEYRGLLIEEAAKNPELEKHIKTIEFARD
ncbi:MAG: hypothetical protein RI571_14960 [Roseovarius sp.]|nr:hypothetical protein [Roseovarius sp.]